MPGTPGPRTGLAAINPTGENPNELRTTLNAVLAWLEANAALTASGLVADRPVSTPSTPGIAGRSYYATDEGITYFDIGTSWVRPDPVQRAPQGPEANLETIRGYAGASGTVLAGSGWTIAHISAGHYQVTFTTPFSGIPAVTPCPVHSAENVGFRISALSASQFSVTIYQAEPSGSSYVDSDFTFTAIGPA